MIIVIDSMIRKFILSAAVCIPLFSFGQDPQPYAALIEPNALKANLSILASDALEGRSTGSRGQKMAAAFIAHHFEKIGLTPINKGSYYQPFNLYSYRLLNITLETTKAKFTSVDIVSNYSHDDGGPKMTEIVLVGGGTEAEIEQVDVKDKMALVIIPDLSYEKIAPVIKSLKAKGCYNIVLYSTAPEAEYLASMEEVRREFNSGMASLNRPKQTDMQWFIVTKKVVEGLFGRVDKLKPVAKMKPVKVKLTTEVAEEIIKTENVMGFLEGSDKKEEVLVITAHYDHVGLAGDESGDRIFNGADDDGSGTVTVLQLATAFAKAKKDGHGPRRSILFMTVSAEELGLYGSEHYTDTDPVVPLSNTVVDLNIDMIGRWDPEHAGKAPYVYVIGADKLSSELHEINVRNNEKYTKLEFDYTYNDENHPSNLYQRSDHWNFAKHRVPIIFYFDGIHEDYHQVSDEVGKIDFDLMSKRGQSVFYTAWEIANRDERLKADK